MRTNTPPISGGPGHPGFTLIEILVTVSIILILVSIGVVAGTRMQANARLTEAKALMLKLNALAEEYASATADHRGTGLTINHSAKPAVTLTGTTVSAPIDWDGERPCVELDVSAAGGYSQNTGELDGEYMSNGKGNLEDQPGFLSNPTTSARERHSSIERFVWALSQMAATRDMLHRSVGVKYLRDTDKDCFPEIIDPWGRPVFYAAFVDHDDNIKMDDFLPQRKTWTAADLGPGGEYAARPGDISRWRPFFASSGPDMRWGDSQIEFEPHKAAKNDANLDGFDDRSDNLYSYDLDRSASEDAEFDALE